MTRKHRLQLLILRSRPAPFGIHQARLRRAIDISINQSHFASLPCEGHGKIGGQRGFAHPAFPTPHCNQATANLFRCHRDADIGDPRNSFQSQMHGLVQRVPLRRGKAGHIKDQACAAFAESGGGGALCGDQAAFAKWILNRFEGGGEKRNISHAGAMRQRRERGKGRTLLRASIRISRSASAKCADQTRVCGQ